MTVNDRACLRLLELVLPGGSDTRWRGPVVGKRVERTAASRTVVRTFYVMFALASLPAAAHKKTGRQHALVAGGPAGTTTEGRLSPVTLRRRLSAALL